MPRVHVLRLCSVFEPVAVDGRSARYDPIGGMQNHTAALTRCLDALGLAQTVVTSRLAGRRGTSRLGGAAAVHRTGLPVPALRQLWALDALRVVLRPPAGPVDVVHAHQGEDLATLLLARLAVRRHRCPLVVTVHCSVRHTLRGRGLRTRLLRAVGGAVERAALRRADAVVVLTDRTAAALRGDGVPAARVATIPSGFDPDLFAAPHDDVLPGAGRPRIGYVGRLAPQKRVDRLVAAVGRMREPASLVVVGDGPDRERVHALAAGLPRVHLTGFVEHAAVPAVLAALDVLVLPSDYEEMGSVLTEALASGLPVVASDVGGIPEVVRDGETGLLVPAGDVAALAAALDRLAADPALRARLAAGARARAADYAWPALAARVAAVYARVRGEAPVGVAA
ncbi:2-deoxystreptamine N-acetyl-D-glucosaminyltransferase / 2-deoxystreptamine glucosyltransferase [Geodermatophilus pulveris]|uniref:2-deoxystreptamine N-acetyl-D-glucosaminyltransferase / 2-deoxystreptamine glucosyltransferase n=1 Tax=Geodermatophilus pulveris TaxID=1564159 RepID=A0A239CEV7_9ACTN|nr:glycosyltransferase family 4 protein [Geodermatophilus pulveris]SNS18499.1 2-deoxystreptamine N-acetyl-D-glucosaminyltransferase / 2-deoxystreptamine glucosyltransferase [Geodermatophilus pulveris]